MLSLRFNALSRRFGRLRILDGISGAVAGGEVLLVEGDNGSGKSTLLSILAGLLRPQGGEIDYRLAERQLETAEWGRVLGYLSPTLQLYPELSVAENLEYFARLRGLGAAEDQGLPTAIALGLPPERATGALSSGMMQRLRWAWALQHRPPGLLLDEPFQNLDTPGIDATTALLCDHLDAGGWAVIANPRQLELPDVVGRIRLAG